MKRFALTSAAALLVLASTSGCTTEVSETWQTGSAWSTSTAAAEYESLVRPVNESSDGVRAAARKLREDPNEVSQFVTACTARGKAYDGFARDLHQGKWPEEAQDAVSSLVQAVSTSVVHHRQCSRIDSLQSAAEWYAADEPMATENASKSHAVRIALGLDAAD